MEKLTYIFSLYRNIGKRIWLSVFICAYSIAAVAGLSNYIQPVSASCILGSVALALSLSQIRSGRQSLRFIWPALAFAVLYLLIPSKTLLFFSIGMSVFFLIEIYAGRIGFLPVVTLLLMSPIFEYITSVFSFPIRLFLTSLSAEIMQTLHIDIYVQGNMLITQGSEFAVDPACMGLHMLIASILAGLILIAIFQKRFKRNLSASGLAAVIGIIFFLNIISNLFRIIFLVYFNIVPGSIMHEIAGAICLLIYVLLPSMYLIEYSITRFGKPYKYNNIQADLHTRKINFAGNIALVVVTVTIVVLGKGMTVNSRKNFIPCAIPGYTATQLTDHVTKLQNNEALIYIKPIAGFYSSDHQPMMCWGGSGYEFKKVQEKQVDGNKIYTAVLQKGNELLYSAWWYDNGLEVTTSQLQWRWKAFRKDTPFVLVNVTAASLPVLKKEIKMLMSSKALNKMLVLK